MRLRRRRATPRRATGASGAQQRDVRPASVPPQARRDRQPRHGGGEQNRASIRAVLLAGEDSLPELHRPTVSLHQHARLRQAEHHRRPRRTPVLRGLRRHVRRAGQGRRHRDSSQDDEVDHRESTHADSAGLARDPLERGRLVVRSVLVHARGQRRGRRDRARRTRAQRPRLLCGGGVYRGRSAVRPRRRVDRQPRRRRHRRRRGCHPDHGRVTRR